MAAGSHSRVSRADDVSTWRRSGKLSDSVVTHDLKAAEVAVVEVDGAKLPTDPGGPRAPTGAGTLTQPALQHLLLRCPLRDRIA
jgi:hypothetical protein